MPHRLTLAKITVTDVKVALPDRCPSCGADLNAAGAVKEFVWGQMAYTGRLYAPGPDDPPGTPSDFDADGSWEQVPDSFIGPEAYACAACGHALAAAG